ncbi:MAG: hypothetical protein RL456_3558 [Pseudomonadota bacterium]|jgi:hypothetical protein
MHNGFMRVSPEPPTPHPDEKPYSVLCGFFFFR